LIKNILGAMYVSTCHFENWSIMSCLDFNKMKLALSTFLNKAKAVDLNSL